MNELETARPDPLDRLPNAPRPVAVIAGVCLLVPAFFLLWAAFGIPFYMPSGGFVMLLVSVVSFWAAILCISTSWRLITNTSRPDGGLVSPRFLMGAAILFAAMPVFSLATGSWRLGRANTAFPIVQMLCYPIIALTLFRLSRKRRR